MIKTYPSCSFCGREFTPGVSWFQVNFCRAAYLADFISELPGVTGWLLAQRTGLLYSDVVKGLMKARVWGLLEWDSEEREQGGKRYRYRVADNWKEIVAVWQQRDML